MGKVRPAQQMLSHTTPLSIKKTAGIISHTVQRRHPGDSGHCFHPYNTVEARTSTETTYMFGGSVNGPPDTLHWDVQEASYSAPPAVNLSSKFI